MLDAALQGVRIASKHLKGVAKTKVTVYIRTAKVLAQDVADETLASDRAVQNAEHLYSSTMSELQSGGYGVTAARAAGSLDVAHEVLGVILKLVA